MQKTASEEWQEISDSSDKARDEAWAAIVGGNATEINEAKDALNKARQREKVFMDKYG